MRFLPVLLLLALLLPRPACAQEVVHAKVLHLKIRGDIDCQKMASDVRAALDEANEDGFGFVLLELDGRAARRDLVWTIGRHIRESGVRSAAVLGGSPGSEVGTGQLAIGLLADATYLKPRIGIESTGSAESHLLKLAPAETDWERNDRELNGALWTALKVRGAETKLSELVVTPGRNLWCDDRDGSATVTDQPGDPGAQVVFASAGELQRVRISAEQAIALKLVDGEVAGHGEVFVKAGIRQSSRRSITILSGLNDARERAMGELREAPVEIERIEEGLRFRRGLDRTITARDYRHAGAAAMLRIRLLDERLAKLDKLLAEYPELLITEERGRSTRPPADSIAGKLYDIRRELDDLRTTAQEYSTRM